MKVDPEYVPDPSNPPKRIATPAVLGWWWASWVISSNFALREFAAELSGETPSDLLRTSYLGLLTDVTEIVAAILAIIVIRSVDLRHEQAFERAGAHVEA